MNKKLKTIAAGAALTLAATASATVSADTVQMLNKVTGEMMTVDTVTGEVISTTPAATPVETTATETAETPVVETAKTSADVKPDLDAQTEVVAETQTQADAAQATTTQADQAVETAKADVATATEAVKEAEATVAKATPENIAANQAEQAENLADQTANATETDEVKAEIASQTQVVADTQTSVATAQAEKDAADADVVAKEADVQAAKDAISGVGLATAEATLEQAKADVVTATDSVAKATTAVETAKQADADRQAKIDAAQTDVNVKTDAVDTAKARLSVAQDNVSSTTANLNKANADLIAAQTALANVDTVTIADLTQFKADKAEGDSDFMTDSGATVIEQSSIKIGQDSKSKIIDIDNLTNEQKIEASFIYEQGLKQLRESLDGASTTSVTQEAINLAQYRATQYEQRGTSPLVDGHIGSGVENLIRLGAKSSITTEADLKQAVYEAFLATSFADAPSNWGHLEANLNFAKNIGIAVANINGDYWLVVAFTNSGETIVNPENPATLQAALVDAQAKQDEAQRLSDNARAALTQASTDYATALEAKTAAEKVLADVSATPLQTQVAENNLRLAEIALTVAKDRVVTAQEAVDNFTADLATKQAKLAEAEQALVDAKGVQATKATALANAESLLATQESILATLNKEYAALLAEKDRLVEEAKELAVELESYLQAPAVLAAAQANLTDKNTVLADTLAKAEVAHKALETVTAKLAEEKAKLAEIQEEYDALKAEEDKVVKGNSNGQTVTLPDGASFVVKGESVQNVNTVIKPKAGVTITKTDTGEQMTYSRVERSKALPQTGSEDSLAMLALGGIMATLGFAGARRKRKG